MAVMLLSVETDWSKVWGRSEEEANMTDADHPI